MSEITVVTPVYNRADKLVTLYSSLCAQSCKNFDWIIVDDGSTDNVSDVVQSFHNEIGIKFISKKNGGKCSALNTALDYCESAYFFVVDSDDYLNPDAIEKVCLTINNIRNYKSIIGIVAYRVFKDGQISGRAFPKNKNSVGYNELNYHYNQDGETALIYQTKFLRMHKHKIVYDEHFLSEEIQYNEMDQLGNLWILREPLIVMEYLEDGLTNHYFENWINNPNGTKLLLSSKYMSNKGLTWIDRVIKKIKTLIQYDVLVMNSRKFRIKESPNVFFSILCFPLAILVKKYVCKEKLTK